MSRDSGATKLELGKRPWVGYITPLPFPWGTAGSRRIAGVAKSLLDLGRDVVVLSAGEPKGVRLLSVGGSGSRLWVVGVPDSADHGVWLARQVGHHLVGGAAAGRWIRAQKPPPSHIILYGGGASFAVRTLQLARDVGATSVADVVEWYSPRQFNGGVVAPAWVSAQVALRWVYPRYDAILAISTFLRDRFSAVPRCAVVPPTLDVSQVAQCGFSQPARASNSLKLCYFGSPGRKDLLTEVIRGFSAARHRLGNSVELSLEIAGPDRSEVESILGGPPPTGVVVVGRIAQTAVGDFVRRCDFSLLLRPDAQYSRAGFPTKFVESMACGTPVISNHTSDLAAYLCDGVNGIVAADGSGEAMSDAIARAALTTSAERARLRSEAQKTAERHFDYRAFNHILERVLFGHVDG